MRASKVTKKNKIISYFTKNPEASVKEVADKFGVVPSNVYVYRRLAREQTITDAQEVVTSTEMVIHPESPAKSWQVAGTHYTNMEVEPWDVVDTWTNDQKLGYYRGNAIKYLMRMGRKDSALVEAAKAGHYVQKLLEVLSKDQGK
jgi:hypothetical protein